MSYFYLAIAIIGEVIEEDREDESDANLWWAGARATGEAELGSRLVVSYWGDFAWVTGREELFAYEDAASGGSVVTARSRPRVNGWGFDDTIGTLPFRFFQPKAIQPDITRLNSAVWIVHENPLDANGDPTGQTGGATVRVPADKTDLMARVAGGDTAANARVQAAQKAVADQAPARAAGLLRAARRVEPHVAALDQPARDLDVVVLEEDDAVEVVLFRGEADDVADELLAWAAAAFSISSCPSPRARICLRIFFRHQVMSFSRWRQCVRHSSSSGRSLIASQQSKSVGSCCHSGPR